MIFKWLLYFILQFNSGKCMWNKSFMFNDVQYRIWSYVCKNWLILHLRSCYLFNLTSVYWRLLRRPKNKIHFCALVTVRPALKSDLIHYFKKYKWNRHYIMSHYKLCPYTLLLPPNMPVIMTENDNRRSSSVVHVC